MCALFLMTGTAQAVSFIDDPVNLLSPADAGALSQELARISSAQDILLVARTVGPLQGVSIEDRAMQVRRLLETDNPSVVLMMVAWSDRKAFIATSGAAKERLPDNVVASIFRNNMLTSLKRNDIYGAFSSTAASISAQIKPVAIGQSGPPEASVPITNRSQVTSSGDTPGVVIALVTLTILGSLVCLFAVISMNKRRTKEREWIERTNRPFARPYSPYVPSGYPHAARASRSYPNAGDTNVFAPIVINNEDHIYTKPNGVDPSPAPVTSVDYGSSFDSSSSDSGGGSGGGFDSGGGSGGSSDGGGGSGGDF
jgi:uncharacterized membrane protein YgcG